MVDFTTQLQTPDAPTQVINPVAERQPAIAGLGEIASNVFGVLDSKQRGDAARAKSQLEVNDRAAENASADLVFKIKNSYEFKNISTLQKAQNAGSMSSTAFESRFRAQLNSLLNRYPDQKGIIYDTIQSSGVESVLFRECNEEKALQSAREDALSSQYKTYYDAYIASGDSTEGLSEAQILELGREKVFAASQFKMLEERVNLAIKESDSKLKARAAELEEDYQGMATSLINYASTSTQPLINDLQNLFDSVDSIEGNQQVLEAAAVIRNRIQQQKMQAIAVMGGVPEKYRATVENYYDEVLSFIDANTSGDLSYSQRNLDLLQSLSTEGEIRGRRAFPVATALSDALGPAANGLITEVFAFSGSQDDFVVSLRNDIVAGLNGLNTPEGIAGAETLKNFVDLNDNPPLIQNLPPKEAGRQLNLKLRAADIHKKDILTGSETIKQDSYNRFTADNAVIGLYYKNRSFNTMTGKEVNKALNLFSDPGTKKAYQEAMTKGDKNSAIASLNAVSAGLVNVLIKARQDGLADESAPGPYKGVGVPLGAKPVEVAGLRMNYDPETQRFEAVRYYADGSEYPAAEGSVEKVDKMNKALDTLTWAGEMTGAMYNFGSVREYREWLATDATPEAFVNSAQVAMRNNPEMLNQAQQYSEYDDPTVASLAKKLKDSVILSSQNNTIMDQVTNGHLETIRAAESNNNYNALYDNQETGRFSNINVTNMTIGEILQFNHPDGEYAQWVKENRASGTGAAGPVGAYQMTYSFLSDMVKRLGLNTNLKFTKEVQDYIAMNSVHDHLVKGKPLSDTWVALKNE